ncbi:MAG: 2-oxoacid:acceptor oxidoreductase family protein [Anaerolineae bacterium]
MHEEVIISGFGGQGALFAGQLLTYAGMAQGKEVTWIPSYGPEMRGGTAHCIVIVSDEPIGSPIISHPTAAIVLNPPSMDKYESLVKSGGLLIINSSLVPRSPVREDIRVVKVPASEISEQLMGSARLANMVTLGALVEMTNVVPLEALSAALEEHLPQRHRDLLEPNKEALKRGADAARVAA